ncbi:MAG: hypothetical protein WAZ48_07110 [Lysobacteraceae bacterium]
MRARFAVGVRVVTRSISPGIFPEVSRGASAREYPAAPGRAGCTLFADFDPDRPESAVSRGILAVRSVDTFLSNPPYG